MKIPNNSWGSKLIFTVEQQLAAFQWLALKAFQHDSIGILISTKYVQGRFRAKVLFIFTTGILCMSHIFFHSNFVVFRFSSPFLSLSLAPIHFELCLIPYHSQTNGTEYFVCLFFNVFNHIEFLDFVFNAHLHKKKFNTQTHSLSCIEHYENKNLRSHDKIPIQTSGAIESFQNLPIRLANAAAAAVHKTTIEL